MRVLVLAALASAEALQAVVRAGGAGAAQDPDPGPQPRRVLRPAEHVATVVEGEAAPPPGSALQMDGVDENAPCKFDAYYNFELDSEGAKQCVHVGVGPAPAKCCPVAACHEEPWASLSFTALENKDGSITCRRSDAAGEPEWDAAAGVWRQADAAWAPPACCQCQAHEWYQWDGDPKAGASCRTSLTSSSMLPHGGRAPLAPREKADACCPPAEHAAAAAADAPAPCAWYAGAWTTSPGFQGIYQGYEFQGTYKDHEFRGMYKGYEFQATHNGHTFQGIYQGYEFQGTYNDHEFRGMYKGYQFQGTYNDHEFRGMYKGYEFQATWKDVRARGLARSLGVCAPPAECAALGADWRLRPVPEACDGDPVCCVQSVQTKSSWPLYH